MPRKPLHLKLSQKINQDAQTGCWIWTGWRCSSGYGEININGKKLRAHRVMFEQRYGPIPPGLFICHHCDNPPCCNPDHLFLGTAKDNSADMVRKGRTGIRNCPRPSNRGSKNGNCRMSEEDVARLRADRAIGMKLDELALKYGCSVSSASRLSNFKTHKLFHAEH